MKLYAIIGESASGKSDLAITIAKQLQLNHKKVAVFSLDSLSVYRFIDIASAKPTITDRIAVKHYGIDLLEPHQICHMGIITQSFKKSFEDCKQDHDVMLLVGGSSFYLKSLIEGLSATPPPLTDTTKLQSLMSNLKHAFDFLTQIDPIHAAQLKENDRYRLQKALEIYLSTDLTPTQYFRKYPRTPAITQEFPIFSVSIDIAKLHAHITLRTQKMLQSGLLDEVKWLLQHYGADIQPAKSIGIKECIQYLKGEISLNMLEEQIALHTRQLAKRQRTFNRTQFPQIKHCDKQSIFQAIIADQNAVSSIRSFKT